MRDRDDFWAAGAESIHRPAPEHHASIDVDDWPLPGRRRRARAEREPKCRGLHPYRADRAVRPRENHFSKRKRYSQVLQTALVLEYSAG